MAPLAPEIAAVCASVASDIALVVDRQGVIRSVAVRGEGLPFSAADWVGRQWSDTVTGETRAKVHKILQEVERTGQSRRRELNHPHASGRDIPVNYAAIRLGTSDTILVAGRDLSAVSAIQQRFLDRQVEMERDFWQQRNREARYRLLFQVATDAVMVVDATTLRIVEANDASIDLFDLPLERLVGQDVAVAVKMLYRPAVHELLVTARVSGQPAEIRVPLAQRIGQISLSATPFRGPEGLQLLVRARTADPNSPVGSTGRSLTDFLERTPEALVVTDAAGRVLMANRSFTRIANANGHREIEGVALAALLACPTAPLVDLLRSVRERALTSARLEGHEQQDAVTWHLSGVLLDDADQECLGFGVRREERALPAVGPTNFLSAISALADELGVENLDSLAERASRLARDYLFDAALARADGNLGIAAGLLGIDESELVAHLAARGRPANGIGGSG